MYHEWSIVNSFAGYGDNKSIKISKSKSAPIYLFGKNDDIDGMNKLMDDMDKYIGDIPR